MSPAETEGYRLIDETLVLFRDYRELISALRDSRPEIHEIIDRLISGQQDPRDARRLAATLELTDDFEDSEHSDMVSSQERGENPNAGSLIQYASNTFRVWVQYSQEHKQWSIVKIQIRGDWPDGYDMKTRSEETYRLLDLLRQISPEAFAGYNPGSSVGSELVPRYAGQLALTGGHQELFHSADG